MNRFHNFIKELTGNNIDNLPHVIHVINVIFKYRFVQNKRDVILKELETYFKGTDIFNISIDTVDVILKLFKVIYKNEHKKLYGYAGYDRVVEIKPTIYVDNDGLFCLGLTNIPAIEFEVLDYTIADNYQLVDLTNEFIIYSKEFEINLDKTSEHITMFRKYFEMKSDDMVFGFDTKLHMSLNNFFSNMIKCKFGKRIKFNGWIGDLKAIISYV